jgi:signal transduction histidine kinase
VEVGPLLAEAAEGWRGQAARRGVALVVVPCSARILSDAGMLGVILRNLVGNAVKYTGAGGRVVIGCRRRERTLSIEVADNGIGIPQDRTREIFDAFRQLDPEQSEGLGMGLAIVRQTAELLGLRVSVTSREGRGSVFRVEAPRLEGRAARPVRAA